MIKAVALTAVEVQISAVDVPMLGVGAKYLNKVPTPEVPRVLP